MANIKPPSAHRIATEVGQRIKEQYDTYGLTCFREIYEAGSSGQQLVREGYIEYQQLPNGKVLAIKKITKVLTIEEAEREE